MLLQLRIPPFLADACITAFARLWLTFLSFTPCGTHAKCSPNQSWFNGHSLILNGTVMQWLYQLYKQKSTANLQHGFAQAMKLLDLFSKINEAGQQLRVGMAEHMSAEIQQLRLRLLANLVQLLVPLAAVSDLHRSVIAPFRKIAVTAGIRYF